MIRYIAIYGSRKFAAQVEYDIAGTVLCVDENIPETPYIKLKIEIVGKEERFAYARKATQEKPAQRKAIQEKPAQKKTKKRRFLIFGREK